MCGRFSLGATATTLVTQFALFENPVWTPRYNVAPTQQARSEISDHLPVWAEFRTDGLDDD